MSPDVTDILSRMQNVFLKSVWLVGVVVVCAPGFMAALVYVLFHLCMIRHVVVIYDQLYWL